jgi:3-hydroxymyristoyl/3-hydroxydecanoyl-(acyl carrier protein) dehydratase
VSGAGLDLTVLAGAIGCPGRLRLRVAVHPESRLFTGHFPGRPLLPGIAQLELATRALGPAVALVGVDLIRLRDPVLPGDVLELILEHDGAGVAHFETRRGETIVATGRGLRWQGKSQRPVSSAAAGSAAPCCLPHRAPALLVREPLPAADRETRAHCAIPADHPLASPDGAPGYLTLEAAAQTAGLFAATGGPDPAEGPAVLVGIRGARFPPALPVGSAFEVRAWREAEAPPLATFRFTALTPTGEASGLLSAHSGQRRRKQNH